MIRLAEITEANFSAVRGLRVAEEQRRFLDTAEGILARGYLYRAECARVWAIEADGECVGLALVKHLDEAPACYDLQQFMIDRRYQNLGYGTQALNLILDMLQAEGLYPIAEVCVNREAFAARHVYEKAGFVDSGYSDPDAPDCLNLICQLRPRERL